MSAVSDVPILRCSGLHKQFGGYAAVSGVDLVVKAGTIHALIGPNGAGKTTLFNLITGVLPPTAGKVVIGERDVTGLRPDGIARAGVVRTFQSVRLFGSMSAVENVLVGRHSRTSAGYLAAAMRLPWRRSTEELASRDRAEQLLEIVGLADRRDTPASELALADQRRLEVARALATDPTLLMLDEPAAGMNPVEVQEAGELFRLIRDQGITILLTEHHMSLVMKISDIVTVLNQGQKIAEGRPDEVTREPAVLEAYLGTQGTH